MIAVRRGAFQTRRSESFIHHGFLRVGQIRKPSEVTESATAKQGIVAHHSGRVLPLGAMRAIIEVSGIAPAE